MNQDQRKPTGQDDIVSRETVAAFKGRDLMTERFAETFGLATAAADALSGG